MISSVVSPVALFGRRIIAICLLIPVNILSIQLFSLFFTQMSSYMFRDSNKNKNTKTKTKDGQSLHTSEKRLDILQNS